MKKNLLESETRNYRKKLKLNEKMEDVAVNCEKIDNNMFEGMFDIDY